MCCLQQDNYKQTEHSKSYAGVDWLFVLESYNSLFYVELMILYINHFNAEV